MIEYDIIARVKADSTIETLMGDRIYPNQIKQGNTYPMAALVMNEQPPINSQSGMCLREYDVLFAVSSTSRKECLEIGERLIEIFNGFRGDMGTSEVIRCRYNGRPMDTLQNDTNLYYIAYEFNILVHIN